MATNRRDVNLVIRAKDEAGKAFDAAAQALQSLLATNDAVGASAEKTGNRLQELATIALSIDKAYAQINRSADSAAAAFARQQAAINESRARLSALEGQAGATARAMDKIRVGIVDQTLAGGDTSGLVAQLKGAAIESNRLESQIEKLTGSVASQEAALESQRSALQQVGSTALAAEAAQEQLARTIEQETAALQRQTAAAQKNARVLATIERATGVTRDRGDLDLLNEQIQAEQALIDKLRAEQDAQTELQRIEEARRRAAMLLPGASSSGKSARDSAAVFQEDDLRRTRETEKALREAAQAEQQMAAAAARLRAQIDPLGDIQDRLNREMAEAERLYRAGKINATELAQAQNLLKQSADRAAQAMGQQNAASGGKPAMFGLTPYAMQNLGYQINDIVTQLASGTSLTQTLAQQGGQLIQIFPRVGSAIVAAFTNPAILATVAAVGALVLGLKEAADQAARLRDFEGALAATADSAAYQATNLAKAADQLERFGLKAEEAVKIVKMFAREGLDPTRFMEFGKTAENMAIILGIDVPDAAEKLIDGMTGGYQAVKSLDNELNFLTATQREHIKTLFEQGKTQDAVNESMRILSDRYQVAADKQRGEWSDAVKSLGNAWDSFLKMLANTGVIQGMIGALDELGRRATSVFNRLNNSTTLEDLNNDIRMFQRRIDELERGKIDFGDPLGLRGIQIREFQGKIAALVRERDALMAQDRQLEASSNVRVQNTERERKATQELEERTRRSADAQKEATDAQRLSAAEAQARAEAERELQQDALKFASEAAKQAYIQQKVTEARREVERDITRERRQQAAEAERQARELERQSRDARNGVEQAKRMIMGFEGHRTRAYWDVNAYRTGYGSDTVTAPDGRVSRVTASTTTDLAGAVRDLERRIVEFQNVIKGQIGAERFNAFTPEQQGALTSIAYNYGSLPKRIIDAVRTGSGEEIAAAVRRLGGDNNGINRGRRNQEAAIFEQPNQGLVQNTLNLEEERLNVQERFNERVADENERRAQQTANLRAQNGLTGEALLNEQRRQAVADAVLQKQQEIDRTNRERANRGQNPIEFTEEQKKAVEELAGAYFDAANAKARVEAPTVEAQRNIAALQAQKTALEQSLQLEMQRGNQAGAEQLHAQLQSVNAQLTQAIQNAIGLWSALGENPEAMATLGKTRAEIDGILLGLKNSIPATEELGRKFLMTGQQFNESFAQGAAQAFDRFAEAVANGENVLTSLRDAFLQFAADFLRQIAQMIIQQAIFNAIGGSTGTGGGGFGGGIAGWIGGLFHDGGVAGRANRTRLVNPAVFANAMRYHGGGVAGLKPGEVPAILEEGERIRTVEQEAALQRQLAGGGRSGAAATPEIKNVIVFDPSEVMSQGLNTKVGQKSMITFVRENAGAIKGALG